MNCPKCNNKTRITDTRTNGGNTYRRRRCTVCKHKFFTEEKQTDGFMQKQIEADYAFKHYYAKKEEAK